MAGATGDKIKQMQSSFPPRPTGAVEPCPYAKTQVAKAEPSPVEVQTAFALTQYGSTAPATAATATTEKAKVKKDWIEIILVDMEGNPVPSVRYRITPPGGAPVEGRLNEHGQAGLYQIEAGNCKVTFPDLDTEAWD